MDFHLVSFLVSFFFLLAHSAVNVGVDPQTEIIDPSNLVRRPFCLTPLVWDPALANTADEHARKCVFNRSLDTDRTAAYAKYLTQAGQPVPNGAYPNALLVGENYGAATGLVTIASWVSIAQNYDCANNVCTGPDVGQCGIFQQLIWNVTTRVGCARYQCNINNPFGQQGANWQFLVCNYWVAGNVAGFRPFPAAQCSGCTSSPTQAPTQTPTVSPTNAPTLTPAPTKAPTTGSPTVAPTPAPTSSPTVAPTPAPTQAPTQAPTVRVYPSTDTINASLEIITPMNGLRAKYCVQPLRYDAQLALTSENFAKTCQFGGISQQSINNAYAAELAKAGMVVPNGNYPYVNSVGITFSATIPSDTNLIAGGSAGSGIWLEEESFWTCPTLACRQGEYCDSFTQIVWNETSKVGCSRYWCLANNPFGLGNSPWNLLICTYWVSALQNTRPFPTTQCTNCVQPVPTRNPTPFPGTPPPTIPTNSPTKAPTQTSAPTKAPTQTPTVAGQTFAPTSAPVATSAPTKAPTQTAAPTKAPTQTPTVAGQTFAPTKAPTQTTAPTKAPTQTPTIPGQTFAPTSAPVATSAPTKAPTQTPTVAGQTFAPTRAPTNSPTQTPTVVGQTFAPTVAPTNNPTSAPTTPRPTSAPTNSPTQTPTVPGQTFAPTNTPTENPTSEGQTSPPTDVPIPTESPTQTPTVPGQTFAPTPPVAPTNNPTQTPTIPGQTFAPTTEPPTVPGQTFAPTKAPTDQSQKPIANVTWTFKANIDFIPREVADLCKLVLLSDTKFFLEELGIPGVFNYFKRMLFQREPESWTASITDTNENTTVYIEAENLANYLKEDGKVDPDSVKVSSNEDSGGLSLLIIIIIIVVVVAVFLLLIIIILVLLGVQAKKNKVQEKDRYDLL